MLPSITLFHSLRHPENGPGEVKYLNGAVCKVRQKGIAEASPQNHHQTEPNAY